MPLSSQNPKYTTGSPDILENKNNIDIMGFETIITDVILEILINVWCEGFGSTYG